MVVLDRAAEKLTDACKMDGSIQIGVGMRVGCTTHFYPLTLKRCIM